MSSSSIPTRATIKEGPSLWAAVVVWFRRMIAIQVRLTERLDRVLPDRYRVDGNADYVYDLVPRYLARGLTVYDVGGGKNPLIGRECKAELQLHVTGLDLDQDQLSAAPAGCYDATVCADITEYRGRGDADLVVCQALLEHVRDTDSALGAIAGILKPGGRALLFVPSRHAVYARLNLLLPQRLKERILFGLYPERRRSQGFPAFYDRCTPAAMEAAAARHGLESEVRRVYFQSDYFRFCAPIHAAWRCWTLLFHSIAGDQAAETYSLVLRKQDTSTTGAV